MAELITLVVALHPMRMGTALATPLVATKLALKSLAVRSRQLNTEINALDVHLGQLIATAAPDLLAVKGVGTDIAGALLVAAGDNPDRMRSEAAFASLCGVAPIPASSGRTKRYRLSRGGDRDANRALYLLALGRMSWEARTRTYMVRRTAAGLSKPEIIRCLKRYLARELYRILTAPPASPLLTAHGDEAASADQTRGNLLHARWHRRWRTAYPGSTVVSAPPLEIPGCKRALREHIDGEADIFRVEDAAGGSTP